MVEYYYKNHPIWYEEYKASENGKYQNDERYRVQKLERGRQYHLKNRERLLESKKQYRLKQKAKQCFQIINLNKPICLTFH